MKKTLIALLAAVVAAGTATAVSAWEENKDYIILGEITAANYPASPSTGLPEVTSGQLLKGTIFTNTIPGGAQNETTTSADLMFDANPQTHYKGTDRGWGGIILDQAYELTEIRVAPNPDIPSSDIHNLVIQGSNNGENWVTIVNMRQDAHGTDYHIFTPQTVTDQRYIDAGYKARTDESIHWLADGGSYSMYRVCSGSVGEIEFYGNPAPATELNDEIASTLNYPTQYWYPFITHIRSNAEIKNSVDGSLVGTIIGGGGIWNKAVYEKAFDNNAKTCFDPSVEGPECWVGLMFDEPHAITEVRILPKRGVYTDVTHGSFQGSNDGKNWVDLAILTIEDVPSKQEWITKTVTDPKGYTYVRYVSRADLQTTAAELLFFGAPAEAAEPFTAEPIIATADYYSGELYYLDTKNTVTDTEISGTPICGDGFFPWRGRDWGLDRGFDGDVTTQYGTIWKLIGPNYWGGLMADTPTAVSSVKLYKDTAMPDALLVQGSVDGHNWITIAEFDPFVDVKDAEGWFTKEVTDTTVYTYFRIMNPDTDHPDTYLAFNELKIYAAAPAVETEVPETEAPVVTPETEAPAVTPADTSAPDTSAPETSAPETTAPSVGTDEPTAPQTFDFGVIAAAAAIVSAAGYALTKKRK